MLESLNKKASLLVETLNNNNEFLKAITRKFIKDFKKVSLVGYEITKKDKECIKLYLLVDGKILSITIEL